MLRFLRAGRLQPRARIIFRSAFCLCAIAGAGRADYRNALFILQGLPAEVSGATSGSVVTPSVAPDGLTGKLLVSGSGSVTFAPSGGVSFSAGGQQRTNSAYFQFSGAQIGQLFPGPNGQLSFSLTSAYNLAERLALPSYNYRYVIQAFDNAGERYSFVVAASSKRLSFSYRADGVSGGYVVPAGQEDEIFGKGVTANFGLTWDGKKVQLTLNGSVVSTVTYQSVPPVWGDSSSMAIGAEDARVYGGGYFSCDDILSQFQIRGALIDSTPPSVFLFAPLPDTNVAGTVTMLAYAQDAASTPTVQFQVDGTNIGDTVTAAPYTLTWDATQVSAGAHRVTAIATDASGNSASTTVSVTVGANTALAADNKENGPNFGPLFSLQGNESEISGLSSGSSIAPSVTFGGLSGTLMTHGTGSARLIDTGNSEGITFSPGGQQQNSDTAYLYFAGPQIGRLLNSQGGEIRFSLTSQQNIADRIVQSGQNVRYVFDAADGKQETFYFWMQEYGGRLSLNYSTNPADNGGYTFPAGQEDALFGKGVRLDIRLVWTDHANTLYLNGSPVASRTFRPRRMNLSNNASFTIGASDSLSYGPGYFANDDVISSFQIVGSTAETTPPSIALNNPGSGRSITGAVALTASASAFSGVTEVQFQVDGNSIGDPLTSPPYIFTWDSGSVADGVHSLSASAADAAGHSAVSSLHVVTANSGADNLPPTSPTGLKVRPRVDGSADLTWAPAFDNIAVTGYFIYRDGDWIDSTADPLYSDSGLTKRQNYTYQIAALDAAGNVSPLSAPWNVTALGEDSVVSTVGPTGSFRYPCQALTKASDNSVIEIDAAGDYSGDVCVIKANGLTIRGVNGRPHLDAAGRNAQGKGTWVIDGDGTTVENIEFSGAKSAQANGAGIRLEGPNLIVRNCYFHDNEDGILAGDSLNSTVLIEFSEFAANGAGDGQSHNLYINHVGSFTFRFNYSHDANVGHLVKTRALRNYILYNRLSDEEGTASYELDVPAGGATYVIGNLIEQGPYSPNSNIVAFGEEGGVGLNAGTQLFVINNTIVNDQESGLFVWNLKDGPEALVQNNLFLGPGQRTLGPVNQISNSDFGDTGLLLDPVNYEYHLLPDTPAMTGADPGTANGVSLAPVWQYVHPSGGAARPAGPLPIGAY